MTTPEGRITTAELDSLGRVAGVINSALGTVTMYYDTYGRIHEVNQGIRAALVNWDASTGFVDSYSAGTIQNPTQHVIDLSVDARGQLSGMTRDDGKQILFGYDNSSNLTLLRRPNGAGFIDHSFASTYVDLISMYDAPDVSGTTGVTQYAWDRDRRFDNLTWPDGPTGLRATYNAAGTVNAGKLNQLKTLSGNVLNTYGYSSFGPSNGHLVSIYAEQQDINTALTWDGPALTGVETTWSDGMTKSVSWGIGDYLRVATETVTAGQPMATTAMAWSIRSSWAANSST